MLAETAALVNSSGEAPPLLEIFGLISEAHELHEKAQNFLELTLMIEAANKEAKNARDTLYNIKSEIDNMMPGLAVLARANPQQLRSDTLKENFGAFLLELERLSDKPASLHEAVNTMRATGSEAWRAFWSERFALTQKKLGLGLGILQNGIRSGSQAHAEQCALSEIELSKAAAEDAHPALKNIKLEFHNRGKLYGFNSALDYMLDMYKIPGDLFQTFMEAAGKIGRKSIDEYLSFSKCTAIKPYELDRFGNRLGGTDYDECVKTVRDCFAARSSLLAEMVDAAIDNRLIDNEPRDGKRSGACITSIHALKRSFILSNDTGSTRAIISLAHEMGHNFHHRMMFRHPIVETRSPMVINEFISKFFELWIMDFMEETGLLSRCGVQEIMLKTFLKTFCQTIAMFGFERRFFELLERGTPDIAEASRIMSDSLREIYGSRLDDSFANPYEWAIKPHLYYTDIAYYNFPYAIGNILAMVLYPRFKADALPIDELGAALSQSGRLRSFRDFLNLLNVAPADILAVCDT